jgi:hypothetical protein
MRLLPALFLLAFATSYAEGQEFQKFECEGVFGAETSHARIAESFGAENVTHAEIAGDEGTYPQATVIFPTVPAKRLSILWHGEERQTPNYIFIGEDSTWTVHGLRVGMTIEEVEDLNGGSFLLGGFNDMDRGAVADWQGGKVTSASGPCRISVEFGYGYLGVPISLDDPLESEGPHSSQDPTYRALGAKIRSISIFYPSAQ